MYFHWCTKLVLKNWLIQSHRQQPKQHHIHTHIFLGVYVNNLRRRTVNIFKYAEDTIMIGKSQKELKKVIDSQWLKKSDRKWTST